MPATKNGKSGYDEEEEAAPAEAQTKRQPQAAGGGERAVPGGPDDYQRTFQQPPAPGGVPGQQTAMPWAQQAPGVGFQGQSPTPWAQTMQRPQMPPGNATAANPAIGAAPGGGGMPQGQPNWAALAQRFGGGGGAGGMPGGGGLAQGQGQGAPPQAFAPRPMAQGNAQQGNPWLQQMLQGAAQRIAAQRGGGGGGMPGGGGGLPPQQQDPRMQQDPRLMQRPPMGGGGWRR